MSLATIIIPSHERAMFLENTLAGFLLQTEQDFEVVVSDNASTDCTKNVIDKYADKLKIKYLYHHEKGAAAARNKAVDIAEGKYCIHVDSDRIPCPVFIEEHIKTIQTKPKTVSIGFKPLILSRFNRNLRISYPVLLDYLKKNPSLQEAIITKEEFTIFDSEHLISNFNEVIEKAYLSETRDNYQDLINVYSENLVNFHFPWILATTGNMGYERELASNIVFDEKYLGWGLEDTDFSYQLYLSNHQFIFNKKAINYHQAHERGKNESKELARNFSYFLEKYPTIEVFLFLRYFKDQITLFEANEIMRQFFEKKNSLLMNDYIALMKALFKG
ncbi:glycosyltransferase [Paenibacillus sp. FSL H8-0122]|uniref:glycosyltransferase family 2 protein n=1 Tax=Paenibacillus sp. FSL H8-0122 TaxID=2954510 RepID=UPI0030F9D48A